VKFSKELVDFPIFQLAYLHTEVCKNPNRPSVDSNVGCFPKDHFWMLINHVVIITPTQVIAHVPNWSRNNAGSQMARSMELREPVALWIYVVSFFS